MVVIALGLAVASVVSLYLSSPRQRWRAAPLAARPARGAAAALALGSLLAFAQVMFVGVAVAAWAISLMLALVVLPYSGVLRSPRRGDS